MSTEPQSCRWHGYADAAALQQAALTNLLAAATQSINERGRFDLVLAGGVTPRGLYQSLRDAGFEWSAWHVYFGDERCLPATDPARNSRMAGEAWLDHVPIPPEQVFPIPAELGADAAALAYAETLRGIGLFDCVLLGLGEDGHTASLFPDHDWGTASDAPDTLAIFDATKPPPQRVSLSARRLSRARQVLCLVAGESKRRAVAGWRNGALLPITAITPPMGLDVLIDETLLDAPAVR